MCVETNRSDAAKTQTLETKGLQADSPPPCSVPKYLHTDFGTVDTIGAAIAVTGKALQSGAVLAVWSVY